MRMGKSGVRFADFVARHQIIGSISNKTVTAAEVTFFNIFAATGAVKDQRILFNVYWDIVKGGTAGAIQFRLIDNGSTATYQFSDALDPVPRWRNPEVPANGTWRHAGSLWLRVVTPGDVNLQWVASSAGSDSTVLAGHTTVTITAFF
jgi:hypothetical protein